MGAAVMIPYSENELKSIYTRFQNGRDDVFNNRMDTNSYPHIDYEVLSEQRCADGRYIGWRPCSENLRLFLAEAPPGDYSNDKSHYFYNQNMETDFYRLLFKSLSIEMTSKQHALLRFFEKDSILLDPIKCPVNKGKIDGKRMRKDDFIDLLGWSSKEILIHEIRFLRPKRIIALGGSAIEAIRCVSSKGADDLPEPGDLMNWLQRHARREVVNVRIPNANSSDDIRVEIIPSLFPSLRNEWKWRAKTGGEFFIKGYFEWVLD
jgi:hypothetical protein